VYSILLWTLALNVSLSLVLALPVLVKLLKSSSFEEITPEWLANFSVSSYYPMQSLLADEDFRFLSRQPGFDPSLYRKLRRERMMIFQQYLSRLIRDFNRLHTTARVLVGNGTEDRSDLLSRLIGLKVRFMLAVLYTQFSYFGCYLGLKTIRVQSAISYLERMAREVSTVSPALGTFSSGYAINEGF
jgi:hypothetical protein